MDVPLLSVSAWRFSFNGVSINIQTKFLLHTSRWNLTQFISKYFLFHTCPDVSRPCSTLLNISWLSSIIINQHSGDLHSFKCPGWINVLRELGTDWQLVLVIPILTHNTWILYQSTLRIITKVDNLRHINYLVKSLVPSQRLMDLLGTPQSGCLKL